jgi:hypothetical protein
MSKYKILEWSGSIIGNNYDPIPIIYIKPDVNFEGYARENKYQFNVKIEGTNSPSYDGKTFFSTVSTSGEVPNYRPKYYEKTGLIVLSLKSDWNGYPPKLGYATIENLPDFSEKNERKNERKNEIFFQTKNEKHVVNIKKKMKPETISLIVIFSFLGFIALCLIVYGIYYFTKKSKK